ncbi:hypothetical protein SS50377_27608 [Spironucleus salmonicida]|uniref:Uncharacterized protein n=1 Tax=Spironucleus salmonicida TaxID=348837 RepID=V6M0F3_9EUKA|nr:hypothetical protein SS50377_27608 [Spironucleus salmonicida]|eukprot:EST46614.1 hypothetical protein SS50377_13418 [Spironucleus salmonicida]
MLQTKIIKYSTEALPLAEINKKVQVILQKRIDARKQLFLQQNRKADIQMEQKLLVGSLQDKIAQMTLMIREDVLTFQEYLNIISDTIDKNPRTYFQLTQYYFEIQSIMGMKRELTPLTSNLKQVQPNTFKYPTDETELLQIYAEDAFLKLALKFLEYARSSARSNVPNFRKLAIQQLAGLTGLVGFEKACIKVIIEKMGDPEISGKAIQVLEQLFKEKNLVQVILCIFEEFQRQSVYYFKDRNKMAEKIMRQAIIFIGFQLKLSDESLSLEAARIIMNFLHEEIKSGVVENLLIQQSLLTLSKLSKICDFRKVEKIDLIVKKLSVLADTVNYQTRTIIVNFLVQILFSMQLQSSNYSMENDQVTSIIDSVINLLLSLPNKLEMQHITPKFFSLMNAVYKLHKITTNGIFSNNMILANIWKKFFNAGLGIENSAVLSNLITLYTDSAQQNFNLRKKENLKTQKGPNYLFSSENLTYNYKTFYKISNAEKSLPFETLLMKQHLNPSIRTFGEQFSQNKFCQIAELKNGAKEQPFGTQFVRRVIDGGVECIYGNGSEINSVHLSSLKRIIDVKAKEKSGKKRQTDEEIAIKALQKQGILDENCNRIYKDDEINKQENQVYEEEFEGEEEEFGDFEGVEIFGGQPEAEKQNFKKMK